MKKKSTWGGRREGTGSPSGNKNAKKEITKNKNFLGIRMIEADYQLIQKALKKSNKTKTNFSKEALIKYAKMILKSKHDQEKKPG